MSVVVVSRTISRPDGSRVSMVVGAFGDKKEAEKWADAVAGQIFALGRGDIVLFDGQVVKNGVQQLLALLGIQDVGHHFVEANVQNVAVTRIIAPNGKGPDGRIVS